jgi:DNA-binding response OmpR family regulator
MKVVPSNNKKSHICILQSGSTLSDMLTNELEVRGYTVRALHTAQEVTTVLSQKNFFPTVLIADATDEHIDTFQILDVLQNQRNPNLATIVVSASSKPVDLDRALAYGVEDYIIKDKFSLEELLSKIRRAELRFSVEPTPMITPSTQDLGAFDTTAIKVLIIEDDQFLRDLASRKLKQEGFQVDVAIDGTVGLLKIEENKPDVVLLDIILPGLDGFDILKKVRAHKDKTVSHMVVILLSNLGQEADVSKGQRLGADDYLIKANFTIDEIIEKIKAAVLLKRSA